MVPLIEDKEMLPAAACEGLVMVALPFAVTLAARHVWAWEHRQPVMMLGFCGENESWVANPAEGQHPAEPCPRPHEE